jgi:hypothetical protein
VAVTVVTGYGLLTVPDGSAAGPVLLTSPATVKVTCTVVLLPAVSLRVTLPLYVPAPSEPRCAVTLKEALVVPASFAGIDSQVPPDGVVTDEVAEK